MKTETIVWGVCIPFYSLFIDIVLPGVLDSVADIQIDFKWTKHWTG